MPGSRARPSISGSSVVPGLPNITETPSVLRIWRNACLPEMSGIGPNDNLSGVALPDSPLLRAARRLPVPFTPVWLMRQAGRYLPEYRAMRARHGFLELCKSPAAAAEVTLQAVARLKPVDVESSVGFVFETARKVCRALPPRVPLVGFAGAPFTVASYVVEGGPSRDYLWVKRMMYEAPGAWRRLMEVLVDATAVYLNGQIAAGAQAVQLFDSWVGALSPDDYREHVLPHSRALIGKLTPEVPVIHFGTGTSALLPLMREAGGDVIGLDWRVDLDAAWAAVGYDVGVQGNLDPATLLGPVATIRARAERILERAGGRPGHIFNLGHGVLKETPPENVKALVDIVHEAS